MRKLFLICCTTALFTIGGCPRPISTVWLILEVRDTNTGLPVSNGRVSVTSSLLMADSFLSDQIPTHSLMAPTDALGRTWIPAVLFADSRTPRQFGVTLSHEDNLESLSLNTSEGAMVQGTTFTCRILDAAASAPRTPLPLAVLGSSPAEILIDAYIDRVIIWSSECQQPILRASSLTLRPQYVESLTLDSVPVGFVGTVSREICDNVTPSPSARYRILVYYDLNDTIPVEPEPFCLDEAGVMVECM